MRLSSENLLNLGFLSQLSGLPRGGFSTQFLTVKVLTQSRKLWCR